MRRNAGDYVKSWGAALIRGAASNPEFTVHVPYTLVGAIAILKFVETGLIFCNDKSLKKIGIFQLDALHCKFTLIQ